jgi:hypothetical protein
MKRRLAAVATLCPLVDARYTPGGATFLFRPIHGMAAVGDDRWTTARLGVPLCPLIADVKDAFLSCKREQGIRMSVQWFTRAERHTLESSGLWTSRAR